MTTGPVTRVMVLGCGAIGLPLAVAFAARGLDVTGVDIDPERLASLSSGRAPGLDPGLSEALARAIAQGRITFARAPLPSPEQRAFIVTVPTPIDADGRPIMTSLDAAIAAT